MPFQKGLIKSTGANVGIQSFRRIARPGVGLSGKGPFDGLFAAAGRGGRGMLAGRGVLAMACQNLQPFQMLSERRPVVGMDMRGQTIRGSSVQDSDYTIEKCNADIDAVRRHLGDNKVNLLGYSPGGFFMTHYAVAHPERVSALILVEPAIYADTEELLRRARLAEAGDGVGAVEATLANVEPGLTNELRLAEAREVVKDWQSAQDMGRVFRLRAESPINDKDLGRLKDVPVLLIGASRSPMNFHVQRLAAAIPNARVWWIDGPSHLDLMSPPYSQRIADIVDLFLSQV